MRSGEAKLIEMEWDSAPETATPVAISVVMPAY